MKRDIQMAEPVALVTGGASFLGRAISLELVRAGFRLAVHYRSSGSKAEALVREIERKGGVGWSVKGDLGDPANVGAIVRRTLAKFGRLDLLVNNASLFFPTPPGADPGSWERLLKVNLIAPYFLIRSAAPSLKKAKGSIVNLTDIYGENPILPRHPAYSASKAGLINLTRYLARELGPGIRVNAVSPGAIRIPGHYGPARKRRLLERSALKRQGSPEDIARAVRFLATQPFITGEVLRVDGGRLL